ncbi:MAG: CDP-alcohol phosphatidyltransferase family protein [Candidatus Dormibacteraeota bacterium]|nr:CDP-alcohol phosphatidyltransferase family protein [Candidatus Dormibacteraeota bacterium]
MSSQQVVERRPLRSRDARWIRRLAALLARVKVAPNAISVAALAAAAGGAACLIEVPRQPAGVQAVLLVLASGLVLLRMLGNVLDGLVAVEGGLRSPAGELFNEVPDRIADAILLVAAGYAIPASAIGVPLGWAAALLAVLTAYIRVFGGSLGLRQCFSGPMAKPQRMGVLAVAIVLSAPESLLLGYRGLAVGAALAVIGAGTLLTGARRLAGIRRRLVQR